MIKVCNIIKKYGSFVAVNNISFEIKEGEIIGLLGQNGAGKSTTMNIITGYIEPTEGNVYINGVDISKRPKKAKKEIGYMPEGVPLYSDLTIKEFVNYMAELKLVNKKERKSQVLEVLKETGLEEIQNKLIRNLSRGQKQRVSLAGALVGKPKVLILDEPTVGLDPKQVVEIRALIKNLGKKHTVIISSHILSEVSQICNRVVILNKGKLVAIDTPQNLENKVSTNESIYITVEDEQNNINKIKNKISQIKDIKLLKELEDKTKQYVITVEKNADIRKQLSLELAKENITIFEMKKADATLEDAFMKIIEGGNK